MARRNFGRYDIAGIVAAIAAPLLIRLGRKLGSKR